MELVSGRRRGFSLSPAFYIFAAILLLRVVVLARMAASPFLLPTQGDMAFYNDWARRILHREGSEHLAFYGLPGYAYLLAALYYVVGYSPFTPELLQACADAGTGVLIYKISVRLFAPDLTRPGRGPCIGALAASGWAFFEPAQAYSAILMPTALAIFVFWFVVWQIVERSEPPKLAWFGLLGCLIGVTATSVATILFILPLLVIACFCKWRSAGSRHRVWLSRLPCTLLLLLGVSLGTAPCWIHNYIYAHDPVVLSAHSGVNLWIGNNPTANGYPKFPPGLHAGQTSMLQDSIAAAEHAAGHPLKRAQVSAYWSRKATNYIHQNFAEWLRLVATKLDNFWNAFQYDDLSIITILREEHVTLPGVSFGIVAALALAAFAFAMADTPAAIWVAGAIVLHVFALLPVFVTERYRLAAVPGLLIFAAYGLWSFAFHCREFRLEPMLAYAGVLAAAVMVVSRPRHDTSLWALDAYNSGIVALELHRYELAEKKLDLAYNYAPDNAEVTFAMGNLRLAQNDKYEAKGYYRKVITLDPRHDRALNNLGVLALSEERWQLAEHFLGQALQQNSRDPTTHFLMAKSFLGEGNPAAARAEIETAVRLRPDQQEFQQLKQLIDRN